MQRFKLGEIVLLNFPFTNVENVKKRSALVIRDFDDGDLMVCRVTSKQCNSKFDIPVNDYQKCGLVLPSFIRVHKIATLETKMVEKQIGKVDYRNIDKVKTIFSDLTEV